VDDVPPRLDFSRAEPRTFTVEGEAADQRLDLYLAPRLRPLSRAALQRLIREGVVRLNGAPARPAARLRPGDRIDVAVPEVRPPSVDPEDLPLTILLEEETFVVLDKAPGMAVHPGRGRPGGTLANAIAHRWGLGGAEGAAYRPGIVHRLDLETSGVMVVAKTEAAHAALADAFKARAVGKEYDALVLGEPPFDEDRIDLPLGRDLVHPTVMAVRFDGGRAAVTEVFVRERFGAASYVRCRPHTGRTHQIRVHLAARGHPLLGDRIYGRRRHAPVATERCMLHAARLDFPHPATGARVVVEAPLPADFERVRLALRQL